MSPKKKKQQRNDVPVLWIMFGVMIFIVLAAWGLSQPQPQAPATPTKAPPPTWTKVPPRVTATKPVASVKTATPVKGTPTQDPIALIPRASLEDAKKAYDAGTAIFIDVRDASSYAADHITGALSIPAAELKDRMKDLDPNAWIIPYCT
jgi:hypothetical protein